MDEVICLSSSSDDEESSSARNANDRRFRKLLEMAQTIMFSKISLKEEYAFPYATLKEMFVVLKKKISEIYSESLKSFIFCNVLQWLQAMKSNYDDLVHDEKFNFILVDFMALYINYKCKLHYKSNTYETTIEPVINELLTSLHIIFNEKTTFVVMTLLKVDVQKQYAVILYPIFNKYLSDTRLYSANDMLRYILLILSFRQWKLLVSDMADKKYIYSIAEGKLTTVSPRVTYMTQKRILPEKVPAVDEINRPFTTISDLIGHAIRQGINGTKILLTNQTMDFPVAVEKYFKQYEQYINRHLSTHRISVDVNRCSYECFPFGNNISQRRELSIHQSTFETRRRDENRTMVQHLTGICDTNDTNNKLCDNKKRVNNIIRRLRDAISIQNLNKSTREVKDRHQANSQGSSSNSISRGVLIKNSSKVSQRSQFDSNDDADVQLILKTSLTRRITQFNDIQPVIYPSVQETTLLNDRIPFCIQGEVSSTTYSDNQISEVSLHHSHQPRQTDIDTAEKMNSDLSNGSAIKPLTSEDEPLALSDSLTVELVESTSSEYNTEQSKAKYDHNETKTNEGENQNSVTPSVFELGQSGDKLKDVSLQQNISSSPLACTEVSSSAMENDHRNEQNSLNLLNNNNQQYVGENKLIQSKLLAFMKENKNESRPSEKCLSKDKLKEIEDERAKRRQSIMIDTDIEWEKIIKKCNLGDYSEINMPNNNEDDQTNNPNITNENGLNQIVIENGNRNGDTLDDIYDRYTQPNVNDANRLEIVKHINNKEIKLNDNMLIALDRKLNSNEFGDLKDLKEQCTKQLLFSEVNQSVLCSMLSSTKILNANEKSETENKSKYKESIPLNTHIYSKIENFLEAEGMCTVQGISNTETYVDERGKRQNENGVKSARQVSHISPNRNKIDDKDSEGFSNTKNKDIDAESVATYVDEKGKRQYENEIESARPVSKIDNKKVKGINNTKNKDINAESIATYVDKKGKGQNETETKNSRPASNISAHHNKIDDKEVQGISNTETYDDEKGKLQNENGIESACLVSNICFDQKEIDSKELSKGNRQNKNEIESACQVSHISVNRNKIDDKDSESFSYTKNKDSDAESVATYVDEKGKRQYENEIESARSVSKIDKKVKGISNTKNKDINAESIATYIDKKGKSQNQTETKIARPASNISSHHNKIDGKEVQGISNTVNVDIIDTECVATYVDEKVKRQSKNEIKSACLVSKILFDQNGIANKEIKGFSKGKRQNKNEIESVCQVSNISVNPNQMHDKEVEGFSNIKNKDIDPESVTTYGDEEGKLQNINEIKIARLVSNISFNQYEIDDKEVKGIGNTIALYVNGGKRQYENEIESARPVCNNNEVKGVSNTEKKDINVESVATYVDEKGQYENELKNSVRNISFNQNETNIPRSEIYIPGVKLPYVLEVECEDSSEENSRNKSSTDIYHIHTTNTSEEVVQQIVNRKTLINDDVTNIDQTIPLNRSNSTSLCIGVDIQKSNISERNETNLCQKNIRTKEKYATLLKVCAAIDSNTPQKNSIRKLNDNNLNSNEGECKKINITLNNSNIVEKEIEIQSEKMTVIENNANSNNSVCSSLHKENPHENHNLESNNQRNNSNHAQTPFKWRLKRKLSECYNFNEFPDWNISEQNTITNKPDLLNSVSTEISPTAIEKTKSVKVFEHTNQLINKLDKKADKHENVMRKYAEKPNEYTFGTDLIQLKENPENVTRKYAENSNEDLLFKKIDKVVDENLIEHTERERETSENVTNKYAENCNEDILLKKINNALNDNSIELEKKETLKPEDITNKYAESSNLLKKIDNALDKDSIEHEQKEIDNPNDLTKKYAQNSYKDMLGDDSIQHRGKNIDNTKNETRNHAKNSNKDMSLKKLDNVLGDNLIEHAEKEKENSGNFTSKYAENCNEEMLLKKISNALNVNSIECEKEEVFNREDVTNKYAENSNVVMLLTKLDNALNEHSIEHEQKEIVSPGDVTKKYAKNSHEDITNIANPENITRKNAENCNEDLLFKKLDNSLGDDIIENRKKFVLNKTAILSTEPCIDMQDYGEKQKNWMSNLGLCRNDYNQFENNINLSEEHKKDVHKNYNKIKKLRNIVETPRGNYSVMQNSLRLSKKRKSILSKVNKLKNKGKRRNKYESKYGNRSPYVNIKKVKIDNSLKQSIQKHALKPATKTKQNNHNKSIDKKEIELIDEMPGNRVTRDALIVGDENIGTTHNLRSESSHVEGANELSQTPLKITQDVQKNDDAAPEKVKTFPCANQSTVIKKNQFVTSKNIKDQMLKIMKERNEKTDKHVTFSTETSFITPIRSQSETIHAEGANELSQISLKITEGILKTDEATSKKANTFPCTNQSTVIKKLQFVTIENTEDKCQKLKTKKEGNEITEKHVTFSTETSYLNPIRNISENINQIKSVGNKKARTDLQKCPKNCVRVANRLLDTKFNSSAQQMHSKFKIKSQKTNSSMKKSTILYAKSVLPIESEISTYNGISRNITRSDEQDRLKIADIDVDNNIFDTISSLTTEEQLVKTTANASIKHHTKGKGNKNVTIKKLPESKLKNVCKEKLFETNSKGCQVKKNISQKEKARHNKDILPEPNLPEDKILAGVRLAPSKNPVPSEKRMQKHEGKILQNHNGTSTNHAQLSESNAAHNPCNKSNNIAAKSKTSILFSVDDEKNKETSSEYIGTKSCFVKVNDTTLDRLKMQKCKKSRKRVVDTTINIQNADEPLMKVSKQISKENWNYEIDAVRNCIQNFNSTKLEKNVELLLKALSSLPKKPSIEAYFVLNKIICTIIYEFLSSADCSKLMISGRNYLYICSKTKVLQSQNIDNAQLLDIENRYKILKKNSENLVALKIIQYLDTFLITFGNIKKHLFNDLWFNENKANIQNYINMLPIEAVINQMNYKNMISYDRTNPPDESINALLETDSTNTGELKTDIPQSIKKSKMNLVERVSSDNHNLAEANEQNIDKISSPNIRCDPSLSNSKISRDSSSIHSFAANSIDVELPFSKLNERSEISVPSDVLLSGPDADFNLPMYQKTMSKLYEIGNSNADSMLEPCLFDSIVENSSDSKLASAELQKHVQGESIDTCDEWDGGLFDCLQDVAPQSDLNLSTREHSILNVSPDIVNHDFTDIYNNIDRIAQAKRQTNQNIATDNSKGFIHTYQSKSCDISSIGHSLSFDIDSDVGIKTTLPSFDFLEDDHSVNLQSSGTDLHSVLKSNSKKVDKKLELPKNIKTTESVPLASSTPKQNVKVDSLQTGTEKNNIKKTRIVTTNGVRHFVQKSKFVCFDARTPIATAHVTQKSKSKLVPFPFWKKTTEKQEIDKKMCQSNGDELELPGENTKRVGKEVNDIKILAADEKLMQKAQNIECMTNVNGKECNIKTVNEPLNRCMGEELSYRNCDSSNLAQVIAPKNT